MATDLLDVSDKLLNGELSVDEHLPIAFGAPTEVHELADGVAFLESFANVTAIESDGRLALIDTGSIPHAAAVHQQVRRWSDAPLDVAVYTHGHADHVNGVPLYEQEDRELRPRVVAHENLPARFDRYRLTNGYNAIINQRQFQTPVPTFPEEFRYPDETYRDELVLDVGGLRVELYHAKGETDDGTWAWIPEHRVLCTGDLFVWVAPNCGNPQKVQRYPAEWAGALRRMASMGAELLLPGHGLPIGGRERIRGVLTETAELLESLCEQTLELMNAGARLDECIHTVRAPAHLLERPWLQPIYDEPEFVVRNLWRLWGGWYDGNPATLKPSPEAELATELARLAGGAGVLAERAHALSDAGDHRLAGHLAEYAALAAPADPGVHRARAAVFGARERAERSLMAQGVFRWARLESERTADEEG